jgi:LEA14-like dessication related protein
LKKLLLFASLLLFVNACSILSELKALSKCEFRLHSLAEPSLCGVEVSQKTSWTDFSFMEGQLIARNLLRSTLPFDIKVNVEIRNPGSTAAALNALQWIAYVDDMQVAQGTVTDRVEIPPSGGLAVVPVLIHTDLIDFLEKDNPRTMLNFALSLVNAKDRSSQVFLKIKPSILVGSQTLEYPGFFTLTKEFSSGD